MIVLRKLTLRSLVTAAVVVPFVGYPVRAVSVHPACIRSDMIDNILDQFAKLGGGP